MASIKVPRPAPFTPAEPAAPEKYPTTGDGPREVFRQADEDLRRGRQDTDQAGRDMQRSKAPPGSPTRRSDKSDGTDDR